MAKDNNQVDDHHCSVIEKKRIETELADCETESGNPDNRQKCEEQVKKVSKKRETACKFS